MYMVRNFVSTRVDITIRNDQIIITISSHTYSRPQIVYQSTFSSIENIFSLRKSVGSKKKVEMPWIKPVPFTCNANSLPQSHQFHIIGIAPITQLGMCVLKI